MHCSTHRLSEMVSPWLDANPDGLMLLARASGVRPKTILSWLQRPRPDIAREVLTHACLWCEVLKLDDDRSMDLILAFYAAHAGESAISDLLHFARVAWDASSEVQRHAEMVLDEFAKFYSTQAHALEQKSGRMPLSGRLLQGVQSPPNGKNFVPDDTL